jgi:outer membrane protein assembly factor BamA
MVDSTRIEPKNSLVLWKSCWIGCVAFIAIWGNAEAQSILKYEVEGMEQQSIVKEFSDSLSREQFVQELIHDIQLKGHPFAVAHSRTFFGDTLNYKIIAGKDFKWVFLSKGNIDDRLALRSGYEEKTFRQQPLDFEKLNIFFEKVLDEAQNDGYPFASIKLDSILQKEEGISAALHFDAGLYISFDTLQITGSSKTDPLYLSRLLKIMPGTGFSQEKLDQSLGVLSKLPFLQIVGEPQVSFQNQKAQVYLPINDRSINTLDGIIGLLPNEVESNKLLVTGQFELALHNVAGKGRNYEVNWQRLSQYSQNLGIQAEEPMVLGSVIDVKASFLLLKEDTTFINKDFRMDFGVRRGPNMYLGFFSRRQTGDLLAVSQWKEAEKLPDIADFRYNSYGINMILNTLDDVFWPRRGWFSEFEGGVGNKRIIQNTGLSSSLYKDMDMINIQYYLKWLAEKHLFYNAQLGALLRLNAGEMANKNLFLNDMYRLGGLKSIRGFNENFFFTNRYVYVNFEPRYYFDQYSYFLLFVDAGGIQNRIGPKGWDWPLSFGGGISLETNGGIFNFIYALGQSNTQVLGFNFSKIHFGYTGRF